MRTQSSRCSFRDCGVLAILIAAFQVSHPQVISRVNPIERAIANHQFPKALQFIDAAIQKRPQDYGLWALRGRVLASSNRGPEALEAYHAALKLRPTYLPALEGIAEIGYYGGDPKARKVLERIVALQPANEPAHAMLGELAYERHDCRAAVAHFAKTPNQVNGRPEALEHLGACLFELKRPGKAASAFRLALSLDPANPRTRFNLGLSLLESGSLQDAIKVLRPLAGGPVPESDVLSLLGEAYESAQQTQEAIEVLRHAAELYPQDAQHYQLLAAICVKHDSYDLAGEVLDAGIAKVPGSPDLRSMRGSLFILTGQTDKAESSFDAATGLSPDASFGRVGARIAYLSSGQPAEAVRILRERLARDPADPDANYFLGRVLLQQSEDPGTPEFEEARTALSKALAARPNFAPARFLESKVFVKLHRDVDAIADLERIVHLDPTFSSAVYQLSRAYARAGRTREAARLEKRIRELLISERTRQRVHLAKTGPERPAGWGD
jgi:tetratricopeptide (TPR) repeat protein